MTQTSIAYRGKITIGNIHIGILETRPCVKLRIVRPV
jgi:hypothetical protein